MFCAAIPAAAATGAAMNSRQNRRRRETEAAGETPKKEIPIKLITLMALGALLAGSIVTHSRMNP
jgi:hypothetical protein